MNHAINIWEEMGGGDLKVLDTLLLERPMLFMNYERIVHYIAKYAEPGKDIPDNLLLLLIMNKSPVALDVIPRQQRYREIEWGGDGPKTLVALALAHGHHALVAHLAEPTKEFIEQLQGLPLTANLIPLLQSIIHSKPELYANLLQMQVEAPPSVLAELEKAMHPTFEPRRTSTIIYRR